MYDRGTLTRKRKKEYNEREDWCPIYLERNSELERNEREKEFEEGLPNHTDGRKGVAH